ncbi:MAG TPA: redox-sensing transcriptional repressor Rex [Spirochaetia bacterium]|nr:redox-sensing transcriptional repressor Rex [Spirochaetales bacterium]HRY80850.1 redox-sensing transcriptional repressor Rex [Spirochaetia bacterium]
MARLKISFTPSIRRLPSYLHIIRNAQRNSQFYISGTVIAQELNLEPIQVRKDLAITGIIGKPKKGYPVDALIAAVERYLGWDEMHDAIVVGAGNLGSALMGYPEFRIHGLHIVAAFDTDPDKIGKKIHGVTVLNLADLEATIRGSKVEYAILTVPSPHAQETADTLVKSGIRAIWNFTNAKLKVSDEVVVHREDLSSGYALLSVMLQTRKNQPA